MTGLLLVFVNGSGVSVPSGSTVIDAVTAADPAAAADVRAGTRLVADSRGIPVASDTPLSGGYVMRLVSARQRADAPPGDDSTDPTNVNDAR